MAGAAEPLARAETGVGWTVTAQDRWAAARLAAAARAPYLASALFALTPLPRSGAGDSLRAYPADERWRIHLDPADLERTAPATIAFWLLHQVTHLLRGHAGRLAALTGPAWSGTAWPGPGDRAGQQADIRRRWNLACDLEVNDDLRGAGGSWPDEAPWPEALGLAPGGLAETYLAELPSLPAAAPDCGPGCYGSDRLTAGNATGHGVSDGYASLLVRDAARRITERHARHGDAPAGWVRWADDVLRPRLPWRQLLAAAIRQRLAAAAGRVDFSYARPSRRAAVMNDVVLPSLRRPRPRVALVLDTSSSMTGDLLDAALAEVTGVLAAVGSDRGSLSVICCDVRSYEAQSVYRASEISILGGGGTDLRAGLHAAAALRPRADLTVVLTDGHSPWPARAPAGMRVVVGLLADDHPPGLPGWAAIVSVSDRLARE